MVHQNISPLFLSVNKLTVLTGGEIKNKFACMRYGERLRRARAETTQADLSAKSGVSQSLISQLENSTTATGSEYTPRLARALGISVDWLADEIGEMKPAQEVSEPIKHLVARMSTMTEREQYRIVRMVDAFADDTEANDCSEPGHCGERAAEG
jgi:transcriptional regulator with XRE-family HTH domain